MNIEFDSKQQVEDFFKENNNNNFNSFKHTVDFLFNDDMFKKFFMNKYEIEPYEDEDNEYTYNNIKNVNISEFVDWLVNESTYEIQEQISDKYVDALEKEIPNNKYFITENCLVELIDSFANENSYISDFNNMKKTYMDYFERNAFSDEYNYHVVKDKNGKSINSAEELNEIKDNIGDTHNINFGYDYKDRDYAFIYVNGELLEGEKWQTHAQILENYLIDNDREEDIPEDYKHGGDVHYSRPSKKRVERLMEEEDAEIAFGHVIDNMALVEVLNGVSEDTVAKTCMKELNIDKAYLTNHLNNVVKRLAKYQVYKKGMIV